MKKILLCSIVLLLLLSSCKKKSDVVINKFADTTFVKIADFKDRRLSDSLYQYFKHDNEQYRKDAVLAFASIQDSLAVDKLADVLYSDKSVEVLKAAAFSLGQTKSKASYQALLKANNAAIEEEVFEAVGKCSDEFPSPIESKLVKSAWGYYRFGLHQKTSDKELLNCLYIIDHTQDTSALFAVANFFARSSSLNNATPSNITKAQQKIITLAGNKNAEVRMNAVYALRKIKTDSSFLAIQNSLLNDTDYRVRVNAAKAMQAFDFPKTKDDLTKALKDKNINVGIASSEVIKAKAIKEFWYELVTLARSEKNFRIQANLYEAALSVGDNKDLTEEIYKKYSTSQNNYEKSALIIALQQSVMAYPFIAEQLFTSTVPVIKSSAATALVAINYNKNFNQSLKKTFADLYIKAIDMGDAAVIGTVTPALADSTLNYKSVINDFSFLYNARKKLSLPKDNEAIQPLEAAIAYVERKKVVPPVKNDFNHAIHWQLVKTIDKNQKAIIKTSKGDITLQLLVEEAPGSVANFVELINQKYFDHKFFHRVVPNFVIQAGCNRGDGWGSEDYSIRSEFSERKYKAGSVGMASAGKDTEGTQWFITHSSTPHLDGRYTIFAEVIGGMDIVHQIEVGDEILSVNLISNNK